MRRKRFRMLAVLLILVSSFNFIPAYALTIQEELSNSDSTLSYCESYQDSKTGKWKTKIVLEITYRDDSGKMVVSEHEMIVDGIVDDFDDIYVFFGYDNWGEPIPNVSQRREEALAKAKANAAAADKENSTSSSVEYVSLAPPMNGKSVAEDQPIPLKKKTGNAWTDKKVEAILKKVIKSGMTDKQKVKAIYDYLIFNCTHVEEGGTLNANIWGEDESMMSLFSSDLGWDIFMAAPIFDTKTGVCDNFAAAFRLLALRAGFPCYTVGGYYVNRNGTKSGHSWNQIKIGKEWFWLDVDVEHKVLVREKRKTPSYFLFLKKDKYWLTNHEWDQDYYIKCK